MTTTLPIRLTAPSADAQIQAQRDAAQAFEAARKRPVFGPFEPLLHSPELMLHAQAMGEYLRYRSALPQRLSELAILITSRVWNQPVEWEIHHPIAISQGVPAAVLDAVAHGRRPEGMTADEAVVHDFLTELHRDKAVSDATYDRAKAAFGEQGVIDLTGIGGYYALLAMAMNVARTPPTDPGGARLPDLAVQA